MVLRKEQNIIVIQGRKCPFKQRNILRGIKLLGGLELKEIDKLLRELTGVGGIQERLSQNYWFANGENKQQFEKDLNRKTEIEKLLGGLPTPTQ